MSDNISLLSTPNGPVVIAHVAPTVLADELLARRTQRRLGAMLGDLPVVLRCRDGLAIAVCSDDDAARRHATSAEVDFLAVLEITAVSQLERAA
ncbi:MAG: hypothetical protein U0S48_23595 [Solirubrobacteraceae bacterium]